LLQWATIQTGKSESHFEKIKVNGLINDVFDLMHNVAIYKKISLIKNFGDDQVLFVDQEMIKTVIRNLLSNAIKFTRAEGSVIITTSKKDNFFEISISDNGIGMKPNILENIFNIGHNTSSPGTNNEKGSGLGLILCKEFVEINNGSIEVESEINKGSRFTIKFTLK